MSATELVGSHKKVDFSRCMKVNIEICKKIQIADSFSQYLSPQNWFTHFMYSVLMLSLFAMFPKTNRQIQPNCCRLVQGKLIYLQSILRCNRNGRFRNNLKSRMKV